jgi:iron complex outermembrane receptor protein
MARLMLAVILCAASALAAQQPPEEQVVVTANAYPVPFENLSRAVTVLTREDISNLPARSIADVLAHAASVDVRSRAPFGLQTDISVRGSAFSQVLILVDGVRINNSQTGHHNSDFPVQLQDIERIEVLRGSGSSIYGADAFGGIINIITRRQTAAARASIAWGQHGLVDGAFGIGFKKGKLEQSLSASANRSSGFMYDRDFRSVSISSHTRIGNGSAIYVSHVNKEFGANGFYGPSPSREWTDQTLVSFEHNRESVAGAKAVYNGYYRTHGDKFLYDIRSPGRFESTHRTHAAGVMAKSRYVFDDALSITMGGELGGDWIASSNLGNHTLARTSMFGEAQWMIGKSIAIYPGLRFDYYSRFGIAASPSLSGSWWIMPRIRLRSSVGRAFRIPTFTELYYRDPNHEASPSLKPESAWSAELGADFIPAKSWYGSMAFFSRQEQNVIDWIRSSAAEKWHSSNIRRIRASGVELSLERSLSAQARLEVHYSRISMNAGHIDYISKYVLDYARDSWSASTRFAMPLALEYQQTLAYKRRADGRSYWLLDGRLERNFRHFTAAVDFTNLLNSRYQEVIGVDMPGRWFTVNLRTR